LAVKLIESVHISGTAAAGDKLFWNSGKIQIFQGD